MSAVASSDSAAAGASDALVPGDYVKKLFDFLTTNGIQSLVVVAALNVVH